MARLSIEREQWNCLTEREKFEMHAALADFFEQAVALFEPTDGLIQAAASDLSHRLNQFGLIGHAEK
jgi:hypothetical protein